MYLKQIHDTSTTTTTIDGNCLMLFKWPIIFAHTMHIYSFQLNNANVFQVFKGIMSGGSPCILRDFTLYESAISSVPHTHII